MVIALANGASGIEPIQSGTPEFVSFLNCLGKVMKKLSIDIVRDGEGATKLVEITVEAR